MDVKAKNKYVLCVDMDGTALEFNYVPLEQLYEKGYFSGLAPHEKVCDAINDIAQNEERILTLIVSSYLTNSDFALEEKNESADKHLNGISKENRVFVPNGDNKASYIREWLENRGYKIDPENIFALDDFTPNLDMFEGAGCNGIKLLNKINGTKGSWNGNSIYFDRDDFKNKLLGVIYEGKQLNDRDYLANINIKEREVVNMEERELVPIKEFFHLNGKIAEGHEIPALHLEREGQEWGAGFADRKPLYDAVKEFEEVNNIENRIIDEDGRYEDKDFLYMGYNKYVAMSHETELAEYKNRFPNLGEHETAYPYLAQVYFAQKDGMKKEDIDFLIDTINSTGKPYMSDALEFGRRSFDAYDKELLSELMKKSPSVMEAISFNISKDMTDVQKETLLHCTDLSTAYVVGGLYKDAIRDGDNSKYDEHAKAIVKIDNDYHSHNEAVWANDAMSNEDKMKNRMSVEWAVEQFGSGIEELKLTPEEITRVGEKLLEERASRPSWDRFAEYVGEVRTEMENVKDENSHGEKNVGRKGNGNHVKNVEDDGKLSAHMADIKEGVKRIMTSDEYIKFLNTRSHLFYKHYSLNNSMSVFVHNPNASYVMGYEQWQDMGRTVRKGEKGIPILVPQYYYEKEKGSLYNQIRANLSAQLQKHPDQIATYQLGKSPMSFTAIKGSPVWGIVYKGKEIGKLETPEKQREFIDARVLNRIPAYFKMEYVFDVSQVETRDKMWVSPKTAKANEIVKDENGKPSYNKVGKILIYNTDERKSKFQPTLAMSVKEIDGEKANKLFAVLKELSEKKGIPFSVVSNDKDDVLKGGANGYFKQVDEQHPNGQIVVSEELLNTEPSRACKTAIHEIAHAIMHNSDRDLASEIGDDNITRGDKEVQAESVAYLVSKNYSIDTSNYSFAYLAEWSNGLGLQSFEKAMGVINKEAEALVSQINAELELHGLTHNLDDKPREALNENDRKALAGTYCQKLLSEQRIVDEQAEVIPTLLKEHQQNSSIQEIVMAQADNLKARQNEISKALEVVVDFENENGREEQDKLLNHLDKAVERIENLKENFDELTEKFTKVKQRDKIGLEQQFNASPLKVLKALSTEYPELKGLSKAQLSYIAQSDYIDRNIKPLLSTNPKAFVEMATKRADDLAKVASKVGTVVEITWCEQWTDKPIFKDGQMMHPKVAEMISKNAEVQIAGLKKEADKVGEYVPYTKCALSIYTLSDKSGELRASKTRMDIGDGTQTSMSDFLHQTESPRTDLLKNFDASLAEKGAYKNKIIDAVVYDAIAKTEEAEITQSENSERDMTVSDWANEIAKEKANSGHEQKEKNHEKKRSEIDK